MLQPISSIYPTIIQNSNIKYDSGGVGASLYGYKFEKQE